MTISKGGDQPFQALTNILYSNDQIPGCKDPISEFQGGPDQGGKNPSSGISILTRIFENTKKEFFNISGFQYYTVPVWTSLAKCSKDRSYLASASFGKQQPGSCRISR